MSCVSWRYVQQDLPERHVAQFPSSWQESPWEEIDLFCAKAVVVLLGRPVGINRNRRTDTRLLKKRNGSYPDTGPSVYCLRYLFPNKVKVDDLITDYIIPSDIHEHT